MNANLVRAGLTTAEARSRLANDGANELPTARRHGAWLLLVEVVSEPMFLLLVVCGAIYMLLGDRIEALMLLGFVFVVIGITFVQQRRTERSLDALRDMSSPQALALRDGVAAKISSRELVCGDVVMLAEGDRVAADIELFEASNLTIDESMLTGESVPVSKFVRENADVGSVDIRAAADSRALSGTLVTQGTARGLVIATGERSALGRIGKSLAALVSTDTPIQRETQRIVKRVAVAGLLLACALAIAYRISTGLWLPALLAGLTLAMAILPEELPVILTLFMGLGAWRLSREKVLARRIPAIELLGATTVLCVDKTGTLTVNRMSVRALWSEAGVHECVQGVLRPLEEALHCLLEYAVLASHRRAFDPMEAAIVQAGQSLLANTEHLHADWLLVDDYPLSREMLAMSRVWRSPSLAEHVIAAKGAPEAIVDLCHMSLKRRAVVAAQVATLARQGLRVLGVARARFGAAPLPDIQHDFDFEFLGLLGLEDPVRPDVPQAIAECRAAGIRVVMITGDHSATALAIARAAGLADDGAVITGQAMSEMDDADLRERLADTHVFSRIPPDQKLRIVQAFRARGDVVAMTGDGVNDAPALKAADIGVAMGARGTDVAREAAALVLLTDDFASLVTAVRYGRRVFANLRKAIVFVVAVHLPIVGLSVLPVLLGWPMLLMPVHILFLQLIIDPACSIVFEAEPIEAGAMTAPPRRLDTRLFDMTVLVRGLCQGAGLLATLLLTFALARHEGESDDAARALTFSVMVLSNLGLIFANRRWDHVSMQGRIPSNSAFQWIAAAATVLLVCILGIPTVGTLFSFTLPTLGMLAVGALLVALNVAWFEGVKRVLKKDATRTEQSGLLHAAGE
jgi:Ca2+-transporting ATPase